MSWKNHKKYAYRDRYIRNTLNARKIYQSYPPLFVAGENLQRGTPRLQDRMQYCSFGVRKVTRLVTPVEEPDDYVTRISQDEFWGLEEKEYEDKYIAVRYNLDRSLHGDGPYWKWWKKQSKRVTRRQNRSYCKSVMDDEERAERKLPEHNFREYTDWSWY